MSSSMLLHFALSLSLFNNIDLTPVLISFQTQYQSHSLIQASLAQSGHLSAKLEVKHKAISRLLKKYRSKCLLMATSSNQPDENMTVGTSKPEEKEYSRYLPLYKAVLRGDWATAERFFDQDPGALTAPINEFSRTALYVAAVHGRNANDFVKKLVDKMPPGSVDEAYGSVLNWAAYVGNTEAVKVILSKNPSLVYYREDDTSPNKRTPFTRAATNGMRDTKDSSKLFPDEDSAAFFMAETISSGFYDLAIVDRLKDGADPERTALARASPIRNAPKLLGYIPSYNTTLEGRKQSRALRAKKIAEASTSGQAPDPDHPLRGLERLPLDRETPDPFSGSNTEMPRAPFTPANLEEEVNPRVAIQTATPTGTVAPASNPTRKRPRPETGGGSGDGSRTSDVPPRAVGDTQPSDPESTDNPAWNPPMSYAGLQVRRGHSVRDDPKVAYALLAGTLLPRDAQELPKDLESALGSACQLHLQTSQHLASVRDYLSDRNKQVTKLIKTSEDHKANADKLKAEVAKFKKEASTANAASLALKQKLEELKAEQKTLIEAADAKGYSEGTAEATEHYKKQVVGLQDKACGVGFIFGLKAAGIPESSELYKAMPKYPRPTPLPAAAEPVTNTETGDKASSPNETGDDKGPKA